MSDFLLKIKDKVCVYMKQRRTHKKTELYYHLWRLFNNLLLVFSQNRKRNKIVIVNV